MFNDGNGYFRGNGTSGRNYSNNFIIASNFYLNYTIFGGVGGFGGCGGNALAETVNSRYDGSNAWQINLWSGGGGGYGGNGRACWGGGGGYGGNGGNGLK